LISGSSVCRAFHFIQDEELTVHTVNNVGKSHAMPAYLIDTPVTEIEDIVKINVGATLRVTYAALPGMIRWCVKNM
jgi:short-subunit dehydrogenase